MKTYKGCQVHPTSKLFALMEVAEKTKKKEDQNAVEAHYNEVHAKFLEQCGLPPDHRFRPYMTGKDTTQRVYPPYVECGIPVTQKMLDEEADMLAIFYDEKGNRRAAPDFGEFASIAEGVLGRL